MCIDPPRGDGDGDLYKIITILDSIHCNHLTSKLITFLDSIHCNHLTSKLISTLPNSQPQNSPKMQFPTILAATILLFSGALAAPTNHNPATHVSPLRPRGRCTLTHGGAHGACEVQGEFGLVYPQCSPDTPVSEASVDLDGTRLTVLLV